MNKSSFLMFLAQYLSPLAFDADKWITVKPHGANHTGSHVMLDDETGEVKAGMGGKFNGYKIGEIRKDFTGPKATSSQISRGQKEAKLQELNKKSRYAFTSLEEREQEFNGWINQGARLWEKEPGVFLLGGVENPNTGRNVWFDLDADIDDIQGIKDKIQQRKNQEKLERADKVKRTITPEKQSDITNAIARGTQLEFLQSGVVVLSGERGPEVEVPKALVPETIRKIKERDGESANLGTSIGNGLSGTISKSGNQDVVKFKQRLSRQEYGIAAEMATLNGGYYSSKNKGFTFENEADAKNFYDAMT